MSTAVSLEVPCGPAAPQLARQFVRRAVTELYGRGPGRRQLNDDAELIVSELAANAVTAGCTGMLLEVHDAGTEMVIDVTDDAAGWPVRTEAGPNDEHGRGLHIVAAVATSWGSEAMSDGSGKHVWATLPTPHRLSVASAGSVTAS